MTDLQIRLSDTKSRQRNIKMQIKELQKEAKKLISVEVHLTDEVAKEEVLNKVESKEIEDNRIYEDEKPNNPYITGKTYWSRVIKPHVLLSLDRAGLPHNSEAAKHILKFEKAMNTARNLRHKSNSEDAYYNFYESKPYNDACSLLIDLNEGGEYGCETAKYYNDFTKYCDVVGVVYNFNIGDCLA